ncbi:MAG: hypothetical protein ABWZ99_09305 [Ilumatobacteraceae bacterium]
MIPDPISRRTARDERHLDLLLAEELAVNHRLVRWLCGYCFKESLGEIDSATTSTGAWDGEARRDASGETGVVVEVCVADGRRRRLLIEGTLDGVLRPMQAERDRRRADLASRAGVPTRCVVVGPGPRLRARSGDLEPFHAAVDLESIGVELRRQAEELDGEPARRRTWRAEALDLLRSVKASTPSDPRRVAVTDWFTARLSGDAPCVVVDRRSLRTTAQGWLSLTLREQVIYKIEWGLVHLYLRDIDGVDRGITVAEAERRLGGRLPAGASVRRDLADMDTVIEIDVGPMPLDECVDDDGPTGQHLRTFERAAQAITDLSSWLDLTGRSLLGEPVEVRRRGSDDRLAVVRARADGHPSLLPYVRPA